MVARLFCRFALITHNNVPNFSRPVFDSRTDTYDALHERSPFAVDAICMVAARVRDGGGQYVLWLHFKVVLTSI